MPHCLHFRAGRRSARLFFHWHIGRADAARHAPELTIDQPREFVGSAAYCLMQRRSFVGGSDRLTTFKPRLHHAALVVRSTLATVLIAEVDFDPRHAIMEVSQGVFHSCTDMGRERLVALDVSIGIDLNLHSFSPWLNLMAVGCREPRRHRYAVFRRRWQDQGRPGGFGGTLGRGTVHGAKPAIAFDVGPYFLAALVPLYRHVAGTYRFANRSANQ